MGQVKPGENVHAALTQRIAELEAQGGGTLELEEGVYGIDQTLTFPASVSLYMKPHTIIRALPGFQGEAVVLKDGGARDQYTACGWVRGGVIDAGRQPLIGLKVDHGSRMEISELEVLDATYKGILVTNGGYEVNLSHIRVNVDLHTHYAPESVGIHYEIADSLVHSVVVIGYETAVRSDASSNDFQTVHVWNFDPDQGPMLYCFYCNGHGDTYSQCYADSPTIAGFYVTKPFQRFFANRIYYSRWAEDNAGAGVLIGPEGTHGTYVGNYFFANQEHTLAKTYDGNLDSATILGENSRGGVVHGGLECQIPSGGGGQHPNPTFNIAGTSFHLSPLSSPPAAGEGEVGDISWVDGGDKAGLYIKTSAGWKRAKLEG
jgi:hypothetical protein